MSSCPTNDIHSLYLDGELPVAYLAEYEAHVKVCPKCAAALARTRAVSLALKRDSDSIEFDSTFRAKSYERLMSRMRFNDTRKKAASFSETTVKRAFYVPFAAAAAILLAVFIPMRISKTANNAATAEVAQIPELITTPKHFAKQVSMNKKNVVINGTLTPNSIGPNVPLSATNVSSPFNSLDSSRFMIIPQQANVGTSNVFTDADIFIPQIETRNNKQLVLKVISPSSNTDQNSWTLVFSTDEDIAQ